MNNKETIVKSQLKEKKMLIIMIVILILADQIVKIINIKMNNNILQITSEDNASYILISIIAIIILIRYVLSNNTFIKIDSRIVIGFAIAGAISNLIDRIWAGQVINYINIPNFTAINLAYIYILVTWIGMAIILTRYTVNRIREKRKNKKEV